MNPPATGWHKRFLDLAALAASWSKDKSRGVGAVIVGRNHEVRSIGFNGFPRRVNDEVEARHQRPAKYKWTEHAERNAIYNAALSGVSTDLCSIYLQWYPCADCARGIIQAGIRDVYCYEPDWNDPTWGADFAVVKEMLLEGQVRVKFFEGKPPEAKI